MTTTINLKPAMKSSCGDPIAASYNNTLKLAYQEILVPGSHDEVYGYEYETELNDLGVDEGRRGKNSRSRVRRASVHSAITVDESLEFDDESTLFNPEEVIELKLMLAELQTQLEVQTDQTNKQKQLASKLVESKKEIEDKNGDLESQVVKISQENSDLMREVKKLRKENKKLQTRLDSNKSFRLRRDFQQRSSSMDHCEPIFSAPHRRTSMGDIISSVVNFSSARSTVSLNTADTSSVDLSAKSASDNDCGVIKDERSKMMHRSDSQISYQGKEYESDDGSATTLTLSAYGFPRSRKSSI